MRLARVVLLAIGLWMVAPFWLQEGMFMDGQIYAAVAQNLADGLGTFWAPVYQPSSPEPYSEQLPMFTGMESLLFRLMGGTLWTERTFMALAWVATALGIAQLHRLVWPERTRDSALWMVAVWSSAPLVGWGMGNHVQELWMAPFAVWASVAMLTPKWAWAGGLLTVGAALFKGPQGLFTLAWLPVLAMFGWIPWSVAVRRFSMVLVAVMLACLALWLWDDAREAVIRNVGNRLVRTFTQERAVTTTHRWWLLGPMLGQWAVLLTTSVAVAWLRFSSLHIAWDRRTWALVSLGLCASLPLLVTHEQRDFYLITSLPFVAVGLGNALEGIPRMGSVGAVRAMGLVAALGLISLPWRRVERDTALRSSLSKFEHMVAPRSSFNVEPDLRLNHELAAYAMRRYRWEVDLANESVHPYRIHRDPSASGAVVLRIQTP